MQSIISEYISRNLNILDLQNELQNLIKSYNTYTKKYLFIYSADSTKASIQGVRVSLEQEDFYTIQDFLRECKAPDLDFYIETGGGSGEAAEEIAKFLHKKFTSVNFVIAGEAKSAGTILAMSGDDISMVETGSLGPIDAQVQIGRYRGSAHDYKEWIDGKREEAIKNKSLNPVDALIIAQISPIEISGVINSLEFAKDLVKEWLEKYKFKNWTITHGQKKTVTQKMRADRAEEIADKLCDHTFWRSHGRSLKIDDLKDLLKINDIDKDPKLADIVYRIKTVIRLIFDSSTIFKLFYTADLRLAKNFVVQQNTSPIQGGSNSGKPSEVVPPLPENVVNAKIDLKCPRCGKNHQVMAYFDTTSELLKKQNLPVNKSVNDNDILICDNCKYELNLQPIKAQLELKTNKKVIFK